MSFLDRKLAPRRRIALDKPHKEPGYFSRRNITLLLIGVPAVAWVAIVLGVWWSIG